MPSFAFSPEQAKAPKLVTESIRATRAAAVFFMDILLAGARRRWRLFILGREEQEGKGGFSST